MIEHKIRAILKQGEGIKNEFKESRKALNKDVYAENSNKPHGYGLIDPADFSPFPKNPVIAKVFKEIGRASVASFG